MFKTAAWFGADAHVGNSPLNHPSAVFSDNCDRNSVLLETGLNRYVFVGNEIFEFSTTSKIRDNDSGKNWTEFGYVSPVGN